MDMTSERRDGRLDSIFTDDPGRALITVVLALVTVVTAIVVALQFDASTSTAEAERRADAAALERSEADARGAGDQIVDYGMYRTWNEQLQRANWAIERFNTLAGTDPQQGALLTVLAQTDTSLADWIRANTELLRPPYTDPQTLQTDFIGYLASRAEAGLRTSERFDTANATANAFQSRSATFVALLTVLAASLFFLGLAATIAGRPRRILVASGLAFAIAGTSGAGILVIQPVHSVGEPAIDAVVRATLETIQGAPRGSLTITPQQRAHAENAIRSSAEAVALDPSYPGAWRSQGETNLQYATAQYLSTEHPDVSALLAKAIEGYERSLIFGRQDFSVQWHLGWARYIAGDLDGSLRATNAALAETPDRFTLFLNRALVELANGDVEQAKTTVEAGLDVAASAQLGSLGSFLAESDFEIGRLAELRPGEAEALRAIRRRVREAEVSIAFAGQPRMPAPAGSLTITSLSALSLLGDGSMGAGQPIADGTTVPATGLAGFRLQLAGREMAGQVVAMRVRRDGLIDHAYSQVWAWPTSDAAGLDLVSPYGRAGFAASPGRYELEVYVGGSLAATHSLTVSPPAG